MIKKISLSVFFILILALILWTYKLQIFLWSLPTIFEFTRPSTININPFIVFRIIKNLFMMTPLLFS